MRAGYKQTKLGEIPEDWEVVNVDDFILNKKGAMKIGPFGSSLKKDTMISSGIKVYGQENIFEKNMSYGERYISHTHYEKLKSCELFAGDFIISMMGTIGKCMVVPEGIEKGIMDSHLLRLQLDLRKVQTSYLSQLFSSKLVLNQVKKLSHGGIMAGLSSKIIKQIIFSLPPLPEQQKIAHILSTVDEKIDLIAQQISETQALKKGLMQRLLTRGIGHTEFKDSPLGEIPAGWEVVKLGEYTMSSAFGPRFSASLYSEVGNVASLRTTDLNEEGHISLDKMPLANLDIDQFESHILQPGDLVISRSGTIGITAIFECFHLPVIPAAFLIRFRLNQEFLFPHFVKYYFNSVIGRKRIIDLSAGGVQKNLKGSSVLNLQIPVPRLKEQAEIVQILTIVDEKIKVLTNKKSEYQTLKKGLMQQLLTGKIRVKTN